MATIIYRRLDLNYEPMFGQGKANFAVDVEAVAQAIQTRLLLFQGEWWESTLEGLPLFQKILGQPGNTQQLEKITLLIQQRILGTPFVVGINRIQTSFNSSTRRFVFYAEVNTQFGLIAVSNLPPQMT